jgi:hypothetical protein
VSAALRAPCLALALSACAARSTPWIGATPQTWPALQAALARSRGARTEHPWAAAARVTLREPRSGRAILGRGGIAVAPGRALRMILVGVAGATLLDAWVTPQHWRVAVPLLGLVRRGGEQAPDDLPIAFLRWWFFTPLDGQLLAATLQGREPMWLLRAGDAVVALRAAACDRGQRLVASRWQRGRAETVDECRGAEGPTAGDRVHYQEGAAGLAIDLVLETVSADPPVAEAFADPDVETAR